MNEEILLSHPFRGERESEGNGEGETFGYSNDNQGDGDDQDLCEDDALLVRSTMKTKKSRQTRGQISQKHSPWRIPGSQLYGKANHKRVNPPIPPILAMGLAKSFSFSCNGVGSELYRRAGKVHQFAEDQRQNPKGHTHHGATVETLLTGSDDDIFVVTLKDLGTGNHEAVGVVSSSDHSRRACSLGAM